MIDDASRYLCEPAYYKQGDCWVNLTLKVGYIHIPRNASTTMKGQFFDERTSRAKEGILRLKEFRMSNCIEYDYSDFYWFVILREPISRFKSSIIRYQKLYPENTFSAAQHISKLSQREHCVFEHQNWFINNVKFDYVCKLETLHEDLDIVASNIGISFSELPELNVSLDKKCVLSSSDIELLEEFYAPDFQIYKDDARILKNVVSSEQRQT